MDYDELYGRIREIIEEAPADFEEIEHEIGPYHLAISTIIDDLLDQNDIIYNPKIDKYEWIE